MNQGMLTNQYRPLVSLSACCTVWHDWARYDMIGSFMVCNCGVHDELYHMHISTSYLHQLCMILNSILHLIISSEIMLIYLTNMRGGYQYLMCFHHIGVLKDHIWVFFRQSEQITQKDGTNKPVYVHDPGSVVYFHVHVTIDNLPRV